MTTSFKLDLGIGLLYPDRMHINGDYGNLRVLSNRCAWRGIQVTTSIISLGDVFESARYDLLLFGGGEDRHQQTFVADDLQKGKAQALREAAEGGMAMLTTGGGFQLCGQYIDTYKGDRIPGVGLLDMWTEEGDERMAGDAVVSCGWLTPSTLVGFERHQGKTYLGETASPMGRRVIGFGNNGEDLFEGCRRHYVFGTYLYGPVLPRNPHFTDALIRMALKRRHGDVPLAPIDDTLEWDAHQSLLDQTGVVDV